MYNIYIKSVLMDYKNQKVSGTRRIVWLLGGGSGKSSTLPIPMLME